MSDQEGPSWTASESEIEHGLSACAEEAFAERKYRSCEHLLRQIMAIRRRLLLSAAEDGRDVGPGVEVGIAPIRYRVASCIVQDGDLSRFPEAADELESALGTLMSHYGPDSKEEGRCMHLRWRILVLLLDVLDKLNTGKLEAWAPLAFLSERASSLAVLLHGARSLEATGCEVRRAALYSQQGRLAEAEEVLQKAYTLRKVRKDWHGLHASCAYG